MDAVDPPATTDDSPSSEDVDGGSAGEHETL